MAAAEFHNHTPFSPLTFETLDLEDDPFQVIILRGSFTILPGKPLRPTQEQQQVRTSPEYFGALNDSSLRTDDDLAPYKANSDIILNTTAYAPRGIPHRRWNVGIRIGSLAKDLIVTGPRHWRWHWWHGWILDAPEPATEVPLRYEYAFGGQWTHEDTADIYEENPCGRGFVDPAHLSRKESVPAPQIESPAEPIEELGKRYRPQGFGPLAKSWLPRRSYAGTYDEQWQRKRHPKLPEDFCVDFHNCAHPDLVYDGYLDGAESVELTHLHPTIPKLRFQLPDYAFLGAITDRAGFRYGRHFLLDTVEIDITTMQVGLVWRLALPLYEDGIALIETRLREDASGREARTRTQDRP